MIKKSIQYIDVTSMFNEEFQKQIYDKDAHHKKLPKNMSVINHVSLDNFKESVKYNSLFFKRFDAFRTGDEIPYEKYEGIYCKNVSDASERNRILNRNKNFKQLAYILPMYDDGDVTSYMHYKLYAAGY